jgi:hypothetical protein
MNELTRSYDARSMVPVESRELVTTKQNFPKRELLKLTVLNANLIDVEFITGVHLGQFYRPSLQDDWGWAPAQAAMFDSDALVVVAAKLAELSGKAWA